MDPENNNSDWFCNLCLQINDFLTEASIVIQQKPIQQACHQFTVVRERFKRIYTELLEDLPIFLLDGSEGNEEEQEENGLPHLTNTNISSTHHFQQGGTKGADAFNHCLEGGLKAPHIETNSVLSVEEVAPENVEAELEFHGSCADPYVRSIIVANISNWLENGLKLQYSSSPLPTEAEGETNRAQTGEKFPPENDNGTTSAKCDECIAYSYMQRTDVSIEEQDEKNTEDDEESGGSDISVDSDFQSDWSISNEDSDSESRDESSDDSDYDSSGDDSGCDSDSDGFILQNDADWDILDNNLL